MKRITYRPSSLTRQVFIILLILYFTLRLGIISEVIIFKLPGYYNQLSIPLTICYYLIIYTLLFLFLFGHRLFYTSYDQGGVTYYNKLIRKSKHIDFTDVGNLILNEKGIDFYISKTKLFTVPFFRMGIVDAIEANDFFLFIKEKKIPFQKKFKILPGYTKYWKILSYFYLFLCIITLISLSKPILVFVVLLQKNIY